VKTHKLKAWPEYFQAVLDGSKPFELRRDDRGYEVGDQLTLEEWDPGKPVLCPAGCPLRHVHGGKFPGYTGRQFDTKVTYILLGGIYGLKEGFVILGLGHVSASRPIPD